MWTRRWPVDSTIVQSAPREVFRLHVAGWQGGQGGPAVHRGESACALQGPGRAASLAGLAGPGAWGQRGGRCLRGRQACALSGAGRCAVMQQHKPHSFTCTLSICHRWWQGVEVCSDIGNSRNIALVSQTTCNLLSDSQTKVSAAHLTVRCCVL